MKTFYGDFELFKNKIINNIPFTLARYGDGELSILKKQNINLLNKLNGEFKYDNQEQKDIEAQQLLTESFTYQNNNYYVGIICPCCGGQTIFHEMVQLSQQQETQLTWANIFVNANYDKFINEITPLFNNYKVITVSHKQSDITKLPFKVWKSYKIGQNAWCSDYAILKEIQQDIQDKENIMCLFMAGPLANILCYKLNQINDKNFYLDIGSVFDNIIGLGKTRGYLRGMPTLKKVCKWG